MESREWGPRVPAELLKTTKSYLQEETMSLGPSRHLKSRQGRRQAGVVPEDPIKCKWPFRVQEPWGAPMHRQQTPGNTKGAWVPLQPDQIKVVGLWANTLIQKGAGMQEPGVDSCLACSASNAISGL